MKYLFILLLISSAHADEAQEFLTDWGALVHIGGLYCDLNINKIEALAEGDLLFEEFFHREPTTQELIIAIMRRDDMAVKYYSNGQMTCEIVRENIPIRSY